MTGLILKGIGGLYTVQTENGLVESRARGIFRHENTQLLPAAMPIRSRYWIKDSCSSPES